MNRRKALIRLGFSILVCCSAIYAVINFPLSLSSDHQDGATDRIARWMLGLERLPGNELPLADTEFYINRTIALDVNGIYVDHADLQLPNTINLLPADEIWKLERDVELKDVVSIRVRHAATGSKCMHFSASVVFGSRGGHGYVFEVRRTVLGIRYYGRRDWIS